LGFAIQGRTLQIPRGERPTPTPCQGGGWSSPLAGCKKKYKKNERKKREKIRKMKKEEKKEKSVFFLFF